MDIVIPTDVFDDQDTGHLKEYLRTLKRPERPQQEFPDREDDREPDLLARVKHCLSSRRRWLAAGLGVVVVAALILFIVDVERHPIILTKVPGPGGGDKEIDTIKGRLNFIDPRGKKIVVFSYAGNAWYVQPTVGNPSIIIDADGHFGAAIHKGLEYAVLLVMYTYTPKDKMPPPPVGGQVLSVVITPPG